MTTSSLPLKTSHHSLLTLLIFLVGFGGALFFVKPLWDEVSASELNNAQRQQQQEQLSGQLQQLKELESALNGGSEIEKSLTLNAIPERLEQDRLMADIQAIALKNQVTVNGVNFSLSANSTDPIKKASMTVNLTGSEDGLLTFLKGIETNPRKIIVKLISVQSGRTDSGTVRLNFNVNLETYYQNTI